MAVPVYSEETYFYEVLMRFGEVAPNKGKLIGASLTQLTQLLKDGIVLNTTINPPEQLALVAGENGQKLSDVLGTVNTETIVQNQLLTASLNVVRAQNWQLQTDRTTLITELAAANAEIARLKGELSVYKPDEESLATEEQPSV